MSNSDAIQDPSPALGGKAYRPGCLIVGFIAMVAGVLLVVTGIGQPDTYWHRVGNLQVFEGPESVIVFLEVQLVTQRPGLPRPSPDRSQPFRLLQIEVAPDGAAKTTVLTPDDFTTFKLSSDPIARLGNAFYVIDWTQDELLLRRIQEDRVELLSLAESQAILESAGLVQFGFSPDETLDRISGRNGWRRLNKWNDVFSFDPIESGAYQMRLWCEGETGDARGIVWAESWAKDAPWMVNLLTVSTKRWWSYKEPSWPYKESRRGRAHRGYAL